MKDKKKGFQQSAIITECPETSDFRPSRAYYLSLRDINTTVSTWIERTELMSFALFVRGNLSTAFFLFFSKTTFKETYQPF